MTISYPNTKDKYMRKMLTNHKTVMQLCIFFIVLGLIPTTAFCDDSEILGASPGMGTDTLALDPVTNINGNYLLQDSMYASRQNLLFLGLAELTIHTLSVKGNETAFDINNPELTKDLSTNFRASLFADGNIGKGLYVHGVTILDSRIDDEYRVYDPSIFRLKMSVKSTEPLWDTWRFTGYSTYDPNYLWEYSNLDTRLLTQPQEKARLELFARMESDDHGYIEGGSIKPSFKGAQFSLHNRSIFGAYADLKSNSLGLEAVGGKLDGKRFREGTSVGFPADGTSGPYYLSNAPVTRASEEVKIEIRDRFDLTTLISSRRLIRDIDYAVDYERGRILLHQPVPSVTAANDPIYVVITYDYQRTSNDEILGIRLNNKINNSNSTSISFLHQFQDNTATTIGLEEPKNLFAGDAVLDFKRFGSGYIEIAGTESDNYSDDDMALRAGWSVNPFEKFKINADLQRIEDNFQTFGNANLTPTINQQRLNTEGIYDLSEKQQFYGSFRNIKNIIPNGLNNTYAGTKKEDIYTLSYKNRERKGLNFGVGFELRNTKNSDNPLTENKRQKRFIGDLSGKQDQFIFINNFEYGAHYELITFRNLVAGGLGNNNTNQFSATVASEPRQGTKIELTQRVRLVKDNDTDLWSDREDATFFNMRTKHSKSFRTFTTYEYKKYTIPGNDLSFWQSDPNKKEQAGSIAFEYLPVEKIKTLGKFTRYDLDQIWTDSTLSKVDDFILGQFTYFFTHHFWLDVETEFHQIKREATLNSRNKTWDFGVRLHWNRDRLNEFTAGLIRRWQLKEDEPVQELKSTNYLLLMNGSVALNKNFFALASFKRFLLRNIYEDEETFIRLEAGYENPKRFRISIGYERIENAIDEVFPDNYYRGHGIFTRIVGKF